jgi:hypothetical protein
MNYESSDVRRRALRRLKVENPYYYKQVVRHDRKYALLGAAILIAFCVAAVMGS